MRKDIAAEKPALRLDSTIHSGEVRASMQKSTLGTRPMKHSHGDSKAANVPLRYTDSFAQCLGREDFREDFGLYQTSASEGRTAEAQ